LASTHCQDRNSGQWWFVGTCVHQDGEGAIEARLIGAPHWEARAARAVSAWIVGQLARLLAEARFADHSAPMPLSLRADASKAGGPAITSPRFSNSCIASVIFPHS